MALNAVILGKQIRQRGDAHDHNPAGTYQFGKLAYCGLIVVEVFNDVECQESVAVRETRGQRFGDIGFDELAIWTVNEFQNAPRDVEAGRAIPGIFERL